MIWLEIEDLPEISENCTVSIMKYIRKNPDIVVNLHTDKVIADIIQSSLEGMIAGKMDRLNKLEIEMEDD